MPPKDPPPQTTTPQELAEWLRDVLDEGAELVEVKAPLTDAPLRSQRFKPLASNDAHSEDALTRIAERIHRACVGDARTHGAAVCMYTAIASRGPGDVVGSLRMAIAGGRAGATGTTEANGGSRLESVGFEALLALHAKHVENLGRLMLSRLEQADTHSLELIAIYKSELESERKARLSVEAQLSASFDQRLATYQKLEELSSLSLDRELERKRQQLSEKRQDWLTEKMDMYLPLALNRFLGGGPGKGGPLGGEALGALMASLKPEQVDGIVAAAKLTPDQTATFYELYSAYGEAYQKKLEGQKRRELAAKNGGESSPAAAEPTARGPAS